MFKSSVFSSTVFKTSVIQKVGGYLRNRKKELKEALKLRDRINSGLTTREVFTKPTQDVKKTVKITIEKETLIPVEKKKRDDSLALMLLME